MSEHRECIQTALGVVLDRLDRDLAHLSAVTDDVTLEFGELSYLLGEMSDVSRRVHALVHEVDDGMLRWAIEKHIAAELIESATRG